ncbi:MAG: hypothetical protein QOG85_1338 [Gaiellaceae bacterium]|jgi:hypothetical protein|nr:hypothetical protein [Gaiellaceae bacterium]
MKRLKTALALAVALVPVAVAATSPSTALAQHESGLNPAQTCTNFRNQWGTDFFNSVYGENATHLNAFGKCVDLAAHS